MLRAGLDRVVLRLGNFELLPPIVPRKPCQDGERELEGSGVIEAAQVDCRTLEDDEGSPPDAVVDLPNDASRHEVMRTCHE